MARKTRSAVTVWLHRAEEARAEGEQAQVAFSDRRKTLEAEADQEQVRREVGQAPEARQSQPARAGRTSFRVLTGVDVVCAVEPVDGAKAIDACCGKHAPIIWG